jgi:endonuclease/exonuclease/phosphatase family metal-dependent hydrolase
MDRDPAYLAECHALQQAVKPFGTLAELKASPEWRQLGPRFQAVLGAIRRWTPPQAPPADPTPERVKVVHWNVEHGNWYEQVETALRCHPDLADADVLMFNEIDLGMARAGNRDVTADLASALNRYSVWAPLFMETTVGRDDDARTAAGRENEEGLFGLAILSRWPIGEVSVIDLPSPEAYQFDVERMVGRHIALIAVIDRPGAPFVAVASHLEVHRTRRHRADQARQIAQALEHERRPVLFAGDFNSHTFDRGRAHDPWFGGLLLMLAPSPTIRRRLLNPDRGAWREPLFDVLKKAGFEWERFVDRQPTLQLRFDRIDEVNFLPRPMMQAMRGWLAWAEKRGTLRLDWICGRGWKGGMGFTVTGLNGPGLASDHAPLVAELW